MEIQTLQDASSIVSSPSLDLFPRVGTNGATSKKKGQTNLKRIKKCNLYLFIYIYTYLYIFIHSKMKNLILQ